MVTCTGCRLISTASTQGPGPVAGDAEIYPPRRAVAFIGPVSRLFRPISAALSVLLKL